MPPSRTRGHRTTLRESNGTIYARTQLFSDIFRHQRSHLFSQPRKIINHNLPHNIIGDSIIGVNAPVTGRDYSPGIGN